MRVKLTRNLLIGGRRHRAGEYATLDAKELKDAAGSFEPVTPQAAKRIAPKRKAKQDERV